jgi:hypothetical protein
MSLSAGNAGGGALLGLGLGRGLEKRDSIKLCLNCESSGCVVQSDELDGKSLSAGNAGGGALLGLGLGLGRGLEKRDSIKLCLNCESSGCVVQSDELDGKSLSAGNVAEAGRGALLGPVLGRGLEKRDSIKLCLNCESSGCVVQSDELDGKSLFAGNVAEASGGALLGPALGRGLEKRDSIKLCLDCESSRCFVQSDEVDGESLSAGNTAEAGRGPLLGPALGRGLEKRDSIKLCLNCESSGRVVQSDELDGKLLSAGNAAGAGRGALPSPCLGGGIKESEFIKSCLDCEFSGCVSGVGSGLSGEGSFESINGRGFDVPGSPESPGDLALCGPCSNQWSESDDRRISGALIQSATFIDRSPDRSHSFCDVTVLSSDTSATLMRTSCIFPEVTGAANAKSMAERVRRMRVIVLDSRIFVGYVD